MKTFLARLVYFLVFCIGFYLLWVIVFGLYIPKGLRKNLPYNLGGYGFLYSRLSNVPTTANTDVLVLGSSHAYRGYDPRIFDQSGLSLYNLGSSAQSFVQTEWVLNKYLDQIKPKLVIVDVYPIVLNSDGVESTIDFLSNGDLDKDLLSISLRTENIKVYNTVIYAAFASITGLSKMYKEKVKSKFDTYIQGGFVENSQTLKVHKRYKPFKYKVAPAQWVSLVRIIDLLKSRKIDFVLVQSPILPARYRSIVNNDVIDKMLKQLGNYNNFNELYNWSKNHFYDDAHLNQSGVAVFDSLLLNNLSLKKNSP